MWHLIVLLKLKVAIQEICTLLVFCTPRLLNMLEHGVLVPRASLSLLTRADLESGGTCIMSFLFMWNGLFEVILKLTLGRGPVLLGTRDIWSCSSSWRSLFKRFLLFLNLRTADVLRDRQGCGGSGGLSFVPHLAWIWSSTLWSPCVVYLLDSLHKVFGIYVRNLNLFTCWRASRLFWCFAFLVDAFGRL